MRHLGIPRFRTHRAHTSCEKGVIDMMVSPYDMIASKRLVLSSLAARVVGHTNVRSPDKTARKEASYSTICSSRSEFDIHPPFFPVEISTPRFAFDDHVVRRSEAPS